MATKKKTIASTPATPNRKKSTGRSASEAGRPLQQVVKHFCKQPAPKIRELDASVSPPRAFSIINFGKQWVNGTSLSYYCFKAGDAVPPAWQGRAADIKEVRLAFGRWKNLGIGLEFVEVARAEDATVRIAFEAKDGSWSYVGRDVRDIREPLDRTMNFGWDLTTPYGKDTALHEIGHTLGLEHEHQNPNAGIVWNVPAVMEYFRGPPNNWNDSNIESNILRKISTDRVKGSAWDPNSVMEYSFEAGLIQEPAQYRTGLKPAGDLSPVDKAWAVNVYPSLAPALPKLAVGLSQKLALLRGETRVFEFKPSRTRTYEVGTFGTSDTVMVLFEVVNGENVQVAGDDDSGVDRNARLSWRMIKGKTYRIGVRLYFADSADETALMVW